MNRLGCFVLAAIVLIVSATFTFAGDIQTPGITTPIPTPTPTALTTALARGGVTQLTSTEENQIVWPDGATMLVEILLTIF